MLYSVDSYGTDLFWHMRLSRRPLLLNDQSPIGVVPRRIRGVCIRCRWRLICISVALFILLDQLRSFGLLVELMEDE